MTFEPWIRVHAHISMKPVIGRAAAYLDVSSHEAIGLMVSFWGGVSLWARRGDLSAVPDSQIEAWAHWPSRRGQKKGKFAQFIREHHLDADGRVREWDKYASKLDDRRERDDSPDGKSTYVYYAVDGDMCKIGWSGNPWSRVAEMRTARPGIRLIAVERGKQDLEKARHIEFADARVEREWFRLTPELRAHIVATTESATITTTVATTESTTNETTVATTDRTTASRAPARAPGRERNGTERNGKEISVLGSSDARSEHLTKAESLAASASATAPRFASLSDLRTATPAVDEFLEQFYQRASDRRRADVGRQLLATLNGGAELRKGQRVFAYTPARLAEKCVEVLLEGVEDPDKAIVVLLKKLGDTSDGSAPGQRQADREADEVIVDAGARAQELSDATAWLEHEAAVQESIAAQLDTHFPAAVGGNEITAISRRLMHDNLVLTAWRAAGAPHPEPAHP